MAKVKVVVKGALHREFIEIVARQLDFYLSIIEGKFPENPDHSALEARRWNNRYYDEPIGIGNKYIVINRFKNEVDLFVDLLTEAVSRENFRKNREDGKENQHEKKL